MNVLLKDGTKTSLRWWDRLFVDDSKVVLDTERDGVVHVMVLTDCRSHVKAEALYEDMTECIRLGKTNFSLDAWLADYKAQKAAKRAAAETGG